MKTHQGYLDHPPPMTIDEALAAEDPLGEIESRICRARAEDLSAAEELFDQALYFLGDTLNGGLVQTMCNSTGELTANVSSFVQQYCNQELVQIFLELTAMFPDGVVPVDRVQRNSAVDRISDHLAFDPFDSLTERFYALEEKYRQGVLKLVMERRAEFSNLASLRPKFGP
jgi:hypothetical protein